MQPILRAVLLAPLAVFVLSSLLSGCDTVPTTSPQQMGQLQAQGKARVVAPHSTFWAGFDIGTHIDMGIRSVDGQPQSDDVIELPAGKHQIGVSCSYAQTMSAVGHGLGPTLVTLDVDLQAGHLYQLSPISGDLSLCMGDIEDITGKDVAGSNAPAGAGSRNGDQVQPGVDHRRAQTQPVIDEWENIALYYSPPANYEVINTLVGIEKGFISVDNTNDTVDDLKKLARTEGATGVLVVVPHEMWGAQAAAAPPAGTGSPVYGAKVPDYWGGARVVGLAIYVPADAEAFQKAAHAHSITCIALTQKKGAAKDAYKAVKGSGTPAEIAAAKQALQAAEDAFDAAYCDDDDWYAEQITGQKD